MYSPSAQGIAKYCTCRTHWIRMKDRAAAAKLRGKVQREDQTMSSSELIVCLWFLPAVFFIVIPLTLLCLWETFRLLKKIANLLGWTSKDESIASSHHQENAA